MHTQKQMGGRVINDNTTRILKIISWSDVMSFHKIFHSSAILKNCMVIGLKFVTWPVGQTVTT